MTLSTIILGAQLGDEGKGKIVDILTSDSHAVVRFQGGHNAGHTLVVDNKKIVLHLLPSSILHKGVFAVMGNGMVISPKALVLEINRIQGEGVDVLERLRISHNATLLLPIHIILDEENEKSLGKNSIGTTKRGIGPAYEDKIARRAIKISDILNLDHCREKCRVLLNYHNRIDLLEDTMEEITKMHNLIAPLIIDVAVFLHEMRQQNKKILFEGAQGTDLDIDHGTYPFVTSSNTTAGYACTGTGTGPRHIDEVWGVAKVYTTRVGSGPFPTELFDEDGAKLAKVGNEFGATTGRPRRCGWFDAVAVKKSAIVNSFSGLCITKLDVLDTFEKIKICTHYEDADGNKYNTAPFNKKDLVPVYETMSGWQCSTSDIKNYVDLPENAKKYLQRIEQLVGIKIVMVSTGAGRENIIYCENLAIV